MTYTQLGTTPLRVSRIAFGCMSLPKAGEAATRLLLQALDSGINLFDTADLYERGGNEERVGKAFEKRRSEVILATKVGNQWRPDGSGWNWNPGKEYILRSVEESLRRLRTDYIDLYQLHGGTIGDPIDETIEAFERLKREGKIRYYGISSIRPNVVREWVKRSDMSSVMLQYSLLDRRPEEALLPLLRKQGIGVLVRGGLAQGLLAGKTAKAYLEYSAAEVAQLAGALRNSRPEGSGAWKALDFVLRNEAVTVAVVGIRTSEQLEAALRSDATPMPGHREWEELTTVLPPLRYREHR